MIHKQLTTYYKVKYGPILIGYNKFNIININILVGRFISDFNILFYKSCPKV